ncbi:MAG: cupin domain-containing protein [Acidobacteriia bacterium]|nr:cupin domain-containing protein [Terriglobia bacterium]
MQRNKFVFSTKETVRYRFPTHVNDLVMDRAEAETSEVFLVVLEPGEGPPLHVHHDTEQIFYIMEGAGVLQVGELLQSCPVNPGDVVRIPPHTLHRVQCQGSHALRYLSVDCFVGGRPAEEPTWESHVKAMCAQNGWNFDDIFRNK